MRLLAPLFALLWLCLFASEARATLNAPTAIGSNSAASTSTTTLVITTTADAAPGTLNVVIGASTSNLNFTVTDSAGNTYTCNTALVVGSTHYRDCYTFVTNDLASGQTITLTFAAGTSNKIGAAYNESGATRVDQEGAGAASTTTTPTITSSTLGYSNELIFGYLAVVAGGSDGAITASTSDAYTAINTVSLATNLRLYMAYRTQASNTATTFAPTLPTSRQVGINYLSVTDFTSSGNRNGPLLGVGP